MPDLPQGEYHPEDSTDSLWMTDTRMRGIGMNLVPERQINQSTLRGEQDSSNKISYAEWSRDAKDHMKTRGAVGRVLVSILEWAERMGDVTITNDALNKLGVAENVIRQMEHAVYMFMKNYTAGHGK